MVVCALGVTAATIRREFFPQRPKIPSVGATVQKDWRTYATVGHELGRPTAAVTVVEFADFQCPVCRRFVRYVDSLRSLGIEVRVLYRHFPLPSHRFALAAVRASECAAEQGEFEAMHSTLFAHQDSLGVASWWWFAKVAGLQDSARFTSCTNDQSPMLNLHRDTTAGNQLGVRGTPTLLIGGLRTNGLPPFDSLRAYVVRASSATEGGISENRKLK